MSYHVLDDIDTLPQFFLKQWMHSLSYSLNSDAWTWIFLLLTGLCLVFVLLFLLSSSRAGRISGFFCAIAALLLAAFALGFALQQKRDYMKADSAVVMLPVVPAKSSPSEGSSTDLFVLHEGTKVVILDNVGDWTNIELSDGRQGWIRTDAMEVI